MPPTGSPSTGSLRTALLSDQIPVCRICLEEDEPREMVRPCRCRGTQGRIHRRCAAEWLRASGRKECDVCGTAFRVRRRALRPPAQWTWPTALSDEPEDQADFICCWLWLLFNARVLHALCTTGPLQIHAELCATFASARIAWLWWASLAFNSLYYALRLAALADKWVDENSELEWAFDPQ
ncbi:RING-CH-type domain-containing protein [Aphelenchoides fujianensis]|nr:RING-CH-type domain-containing protein [Aphelenchoides fujianensis]